MSYNKETGMYEGYIYKIWNDINDKLYYGQTIRTVLDRWKQHKYTAHTNKKLTLYRAMSKYGEENFHIEEIEKHQALTKEELISILNDREIYYITTNNTIVPYGYNMTFGGNQTSIYNTKRVDVYDSTGNFIMECKSIKEASILFNTNSSTIGYCCNGIYVPKNEYIFRFHGDLFDEYRVIPISEIKKIKVFQFDLSGRLIAEYPSVIEASNSLKISTSSIRTGLNSKTYTADGYYFSKDNVFDCDVNEAYNELLLKNIKIPVKAFNLSGDLVGEYSSIYEAIKVLNLKCGDQSIKKVCDGKWYSCEGYIWRYINDDFDKFSLEPSNVVVDVYDVYGNFITTCNSMASAKQSFDICSIANISACCRGKVSTVCSFVFRYHECDFNEYSVRYTYKDELRKIDVYDIDGNLIDTVHVGKLIELNYIDKSCISKLFQVCNGIAIRNYIKQKTYRWHGDSFENPGTIDTYPHPDYKHLFEINPTATREDVINLLRQSLDDVGIYSTNQQSVAQSANK